jgi:hypothetical protein
MAGFTHARRGAHAAIELLAALVLALTCFLAFFVVLAALLTHTSAAAAFGTATVVSLGCWGGLLIATGSRKTAGRHFRDAPAVEGGEGATSTGGDMRPANLSRLRRSPVAERGKLWC